MPFVSQAEVAAGHYCYQSLVLRTEGGQEREQEGKISLRGSLRWKTFRCLYSFHQERIGLV